MTAAKLNLPPVEKGATYRHTLIWKSSTGSPIDLTGCTAKMQVREEATAASVLLELSTTNHRIEITPLTGQLDFFVDDAVTDLLATEGGVYDLEIYHPNGDVTRLCQGTLPFSEEVTRG
jgi:hypothetical protein